MVKLFYVQIGRSVIVGHKGQNENCRDPMDGSDVILK